MITKAIVEEIISPYSARVRMPILNAIKGAKQSTPTDELSIATICTIPNAKNNINVGDIVFVGFEDNDYSKPIIIGHLFKENKTKDLYDNTSLDLVLRSLNVQYDTTLSSNTKIGEVIGKEIQCLQGIRSNIQKQIDDIEQSYGDVEAMTNSEIDKILST
jgi:hypothetical protein